MDFLIIFFLLVFEKENDGELDVRNVGDPVTGYQPLTFHSFGFVGDFCSIVGSACQGDAVAF